MHSLHVAFVYESLVMCVICHYFNSARQRGVRKRMLPGNGCSFCISFLCDTSASEGACPFLGRVAEVKREVLGDDETESFDGVFFGS